ncbi:MAG: polyprenyl synthetase family protein [Proteobacteria bacterium]|nr:polyprenyl synthetase family protein [Pseudomonadota bacterium]
MPSSKIFDLVADELSQVEAELFHGLNSGIHVIDDVGNHILKSGGKRFRPLIALLVSRFFKYQGKHHIDLACALEYLHTATLLHDDVVDNGRIRRGSSTANSVWGDKTSVLVGDFLFSYSFSLLSAACECSAILGEAQQEVQHALRSYGLNLGIAFQLIDDLLDYVASEEGFGKSIGKDLKEKKITLPLIYTLQNLSGDKKSTVLATLNKNVLSEDKVSWIIRLVKDEGGFDCVLKQAKKYSGLAKENLRSLPSSPEKNALLEAADYVVDRKS